MSSTGSPWDVTDTRREQEPLVRLRSHRGWLCALILLLGLLVRLPFAPMDFSASSDLKTFMDWQRTAQTLGLERIYESGKVDYPPIWLYWLAAAGWIRERIAPASDAWRTALLKLPSIIADVVTGGLIALTLRKQSARASLLGASAYLFNPGIGYVSAYWGQIDSLYTVFLVASVIALNHGATVWVWLLYTLALATKHQSLALLPLVLTLSVTKRGARGLLTGLATAALTAATLLLPWLLTGHLRDFVQTLTKWPNESVRVDVSAYNLWYLLRFGRVHNVSSELHPLGLPFTYQTIGFILFGGYVLLVILLALRSHTVALPAAALSLGLFMLPTQIHERFMFPVLALLAVASATAPRLWLAYGVLSATFFFNLITVAPFTDLLGTNLVAADASSINIVILKFLSILTAAINVGALVGLTYVLAISRRKSLKGI